MKIGFVGLGRMGGHVAENYYSRDTQYRVNVRMDNGTNRSFTYKAAPGFQPGDLMLITDHINLTAVTSNNTGSTVK